MVVQDHSSCNQCGRCNGDSTSKATPEETKKVNGPSPADLFTEQLAKLLTKRYLEAGSTDEIQAAYGSKV